MKKGILSGLGEKSFFALSSAQFNAALADPRYDYT